MLQDKRSELASEKKKKLLQQLVAKLSENDADLYYRPTSYIASQIKKHVESSTDMPREDKELLQDMTQRDIEVILSLH